MVEHLAIDNIYSVYEQHGYMQLILKPIRTSSVSIAFSLIYLLSENRTCSFAGTFLSGA